MDGTPELYRSKGSSRTIYDRALNFLKKKYLIRYNIIALELEIKLKYEDSNWSDLNINSLLIELAQSGIDISMAKLEILVRSHLIDQYDPIREYFENLETWDGNDHIGKLCGYVKTLDGRNLLMIMGVLNECMNRDINVWTIKYITDWAAISTPKFWRLHSVFPPKLSGI